MKRKRVLFFLLFFIIFSAVTSAQITFSGLDLSADNRLLFTASLGAGENALFATQLPASGAVFPSGVNPGGVYIDAYPVQQLSVFPEKMDLIEAGRTLQIRNSFGAVRVSVSGGLPMPIPGLPSFAGANHASLGRPEEMTPSGDGRWLLYLDPVSPAFGNLVMLDVYSGAKTQIAPRLERPENLFPASWSPDSRFFIYERSGKLYYYTIGAQAMPAEENIRLIGEGAINSVVWGKGGDFYYLRGSVLYHVRGGELFARTLYSPFLEIGAVAGKIPFEFDPCFDRFWIAPDARSLLVSKGRRSLFYYSLTSGGENLSSEINMPYLLLPRSCSDLDVFWSQEGTVTALVSIPNQSGKEMRAWRLNISERGGVFELLPQAGAGASFSSGCLSPDGKLALFWGQGGILLYDYESWTLLETLSARPGISCLWAGNWEFITGDDRKIERFTITHSGTVLENSEGARYGALITRRDLVCLSGISQSGFEEGTNRFIARSGSAWFSTGGRSSWTSVNNPRLKMASQISSRYRVYLERQGAGFYANLPMIRNISSTGTFPLFPPVSNTEAETGAKEAALCFDLYDDDQGLPEILEALGRFGIKATFFINGEFIRRHPESAAELASSGHELASMFYAPIDLSDARYRSGSDFISRGLARNEDEFYRAAGKELTLLWHPPWYLLSPDIEAAAARVGYVTSSRDIDPLDWVSLDDEKRLGLVQLSPAEMIDRIMREIKNGAIIPIRLGLLSGGRKDYLFNRINVLLDALRRDGYTLTTVSAIVEQF